MADKRKESLELKKLVAQYLQNGGKISYIPEGVRGKCLPKNKSLDRIPKIPTGARCLICDWSPTDSRSISNPEIAEYGGNQLVIDDMTGNMLCRVCLSKASGMNRDFKIEQDPAYGLSAEVLDYDALSFLSSSGESLQPGRQVYDLILNQTAEGSRRKGRSVEEG